MQAEDLPSTRGERDEPAAGSYSLRGLLFRFKKAPEPLLIVGAGILGLLLQKAGMR
jgi:hypothetical protein